MLCCLKQSLPPSLFFKISEPHNVLTKNMLLEQIGKSTLFTWHLLITKEVKVLNIWQINALEELLKEHNKIDQKGNSTV